MGGVLVKNIRAWLWALLTVGVILVLTQLGINWNSILQRMIGRTYNMYPYFWGQIALFFLFGVILNTNLIISAIRKRKRPPISKEHIILACITAAIILFSFISSFAFRSPFYFRYYSLVQMALIYLGFTCSGIFLAGKE
jgi:hypothetical protein